VRIVTRRPQTTVSKSKNGRRISYSLLSAVDVIEVMMPTRTTQLPDTQARSQKHQSRQVPIVDGLLRASVIPAGLPGIQGKPACACGGGCPRCQAKSNLTVSQPNDPAEREADAIADKITMMKEPAEAIEPFARTDSASGATERSDEASEEKGKAIRRKPLPSNASIPPQTPAHVQSVIGSGGNPLDGQTRNFFEPRLGCDLRSVRIHIGNAAAESARALQARAYTLGNNIVFGHGEFKPDLEGGKHLLAHELAHVGQQSGSTKSIQRQTEGLPASSLIPSLSAAPFGNQDCLLEHSCSVSAATPVSGAPLSAAELASRRQQVQQSIDRARATYPVAAGNLQHWLDNTGSTRILPGATFQAADSGVPAFLEHGQLSQEAHLDMFHDGIQRRLSASDPESLLPVGTRRVLRYCNSMRASPVGTGVEGDLSIALGGFTVKSWVTLSARQVSSSIPLVTQYQVSVESWRVQVCDRYDWIAGALAQMPIPLADSELVTIPFPPDAVQITPAPVPGYSTVRLRDNWFRELEAAGGGRQYAVYSEIFDAPANLRAILEGYTFNVL